MGVRQKVGGVLQGLGEGAVGALWIAGSTAACRSPSSGD